MRVLSGGSLVTMQAFMARYDEFVREGWIIGTAWGLFSKAVPGFVGYQVTSLAT
jgi:hypothetical protein